MNGRTYLVHLPTDMQELNRWAGVRGLSRNGFMDTGHVLHSLLSGTFGKGMLQPFRLLHARYQREASVYAYAGVDCQELRETADTVATPDAVRVIPLARIESKPMPEALANGQRIGFDLRCRAVRRLAMPIDGGRGEIPVGAEVDAFELEAAREFPGKVRPTPSRLREAGIEEMDAYRRWLAEKLDGAARLETVRVRTLIRARAVRGSSRRLTGRGPDIVFHGTVRIQDPGRFQDLIRRGVGRHKAYGYGMVLLRPADAESKAAA